MKKVLKVILIILLVIVLILAAALIFLSVTEYKPADTEIVSSFRDGDSRDPGDTISVLSWNIGYGGLGNQADFTMDGGSGSGKPETEELFNTYFDGIKRTVRDNGADVYILQEVDTNSSRSYGVNEAEELANIADVSFAAHALNYSCPFVPYPLPPIGRVNSGLLTMTSLDAEDEAVRVSLPCPFSWPLRTANLKRCLLVSRVDLPDTDKELVIVNLHLEAYDDGEGKKAQTEKLFDVLEAEYAKGNYVIAGGDFNQTFPGSLDAFPVKNAELWTPGVLEDSILPEGWSFAYDNSKPTCRLLNQPYDPESSATQYYVIDGFILSPNVSPVSVETIDLDFEFSDHNPVRLEVSLG